MTGPDDQQVFQNLQTSFADRHIGTTPADQQTMLDAVGQTSLDALVRAADAILGDPERAAAMGRAATATVRSYCSRERITEINRGLFAGS